jgi:hypothetical protein
MSQDRPAPPAVLYLDEEKAADLVQEGRGAREEMMVGAMNVLQEMADQRRPRKSSMLRWRITGVVDQRTMTLALRLPLLLKPKMISI